LREGVSAEPPTSGASLRATIVPDAANGPSRDGATGSHRIGNSPWSPKSRIKTLSEIPIGIVRRQRADSPGCWKDLEKAKRNGLVWKGASRPRHTVRESRELLAEAICLSLRCTPETGVM